jgi:uncharacterized protein
MDAAEVLEGLSELDRLPVEAIRAARADRDTMVPVFLRSIEAFLSEQGEQVAPEALFLIFHLLGEWREKSAYRPLAALLRSPPDALDPVLGDSITETTHRVMAAVFDGDPDPLYEIIRDPEADEYVRSSMCRTLAVLTRRGELPRAAVAEFLRDSFSQLEPQQYSYVWHGLGEAVAWLGLIELKPLVEQAFSRGLIDDTWYTFEEFEEDLQDAIDHPDAGPLDRDLDLFGDVIEEMSGWACFQPKEKNKDRSTWTLLPSPQLPFIEPLRKVGRNDPCPCGSGKKFKKCCLNLDIADIE